MSSLNHVFRSIWSEALGAWVAVSEVASARGKRSGSRVVRVPNIAGVNEEIDDIHHHRFKFALLALACGLALDAQSNPMGGQVVNGQASFNTTGNTLTVTNTPGTIINWQSFSINAAEVTRFQQQNAASTVLNRVVTNNPSVILGTLSSNGQVYLVNANGIMFGAGSTVDVAGMVATTLNLSDADFLAGRHNYTAVPGAQNVSNAGNINAQQAGYVYLIAPNVENSGVITAPNGEVLLAAGSEVQLVNSLDPNLRVSITAPAGNATNIGQLIAQSGSLGLFGTMVRNAGTVSADSAVSQGGKIVFKASGTTILEAGSVTSATGASGGSIQVQGSNVGLIGNASVDASGNNGGGTVLVGGDAHGANAGVQNAQNTFVDANVNIRADATQNGDGGKIIVWSDNITRAYGNLSAQGGANGGNGGFIETSGHYLDVTGITASGQATRGQAGTWLLDPWNVTIVGAPSADLNGTFTGGTWTPNATGSTILNTTIEAALNGGTSVTITTNGTGLEAGDITVNAAINMTGATPATLTLQAANNIFINQSISSNNVTPTALNLVLDHGATGSATLSNALNLSGGNLDVRSAGAIGTGTLNVQGWTTTLTGSLLASSLVINGGSLNLNGAATTLSSVTLTSGSLSNASTLTMGSLTFNPNAYQYPALGGVGDKVVTGNTSFAPQLGNNFPYAYIYDGALITQGATSYTPSAYYPTAQMQIYMGNAAAAINNTGTFTMNGFNIFGMGGSFTNSGSGVVSGTGSGTFGVAFNNNSAAAAGVAVGANGILRLNGGGSSSGTFDAASTGSIIFGSGIHSLTNSVSITGAGNIQFGAGPGYGGGTTTIAGSIAATNLWAYAGSASVNGVANIGNLINSGAILNLNDATTPIALSTFDVSAGTTNIAAATTVPTLNWTGGTLGGAGTLNVTTLNLNPATPNSVMLNGKTLNVSGATTQGTSGAQGARMTLYMTNGAIINNAGAWTMNNAEIFDRDPIPTSVFNNNLNGSVAVPAGGFGWVDGTAFNANGGTTSGLLAIGTMTVNAPTDLTGLIVSQSLINNSTVTIGTGTTSIYGNVANNGTVDVLAGGTLNVNGAFTNSATTGVLNLAGTLATGYGTTNSGTTTLAATGAIDGVFTNAAMVNAAGGTINGTFVNANLGQLNVVGGTLSIASTGALTNNAGGSIGLGNGVTGGGIDYLGGTTLVNNGILSSSAPTSNQITGSVTNNGSIRVTGGDLVLIPSAFDSSAGSLDVTAGSTLQVLGGTVLLGTSTQLGAGGGVVLLAPNGATPLNLTLTSAFSNPVSTQTHLAFANSALVSVSGAATFSNYGTLDISGIAIGNSTPLANYGTLTFAGTQGVANYVQGDTAVLRGTVAGAGSNQFNVSTDVHFQGVSTLDNLTLNTTTSATTASVGWVGVPAAVTMQNGAVINNNGNWSMNQGVIQDLAATPNTTFSNNAGATLIVPTGGTGIFFGTVLSNAGTQTGSLVAGTYVNPVATTFDITVNQALITGSIINNGLLQATNGGTVPGNVVNNNQFDVSGALTIGGSFTNNATTNLNAGSTLSMGMGGANNGTVNASGPSTLTGPSLAFNNPGTFNVNSSLASPVTVSAPFNNNGTVNVNTGALNMNGGGVGGGVFNLAAGAALNIGVGGYTQTQTGSITGGGDLSVTSSVLLLNGTVSSIGTLTLSAAAQLNNAQPISVTNLAVVGSSSLVGTGSVTVSGNLDLSAGSLYLLLNSTLVNNGVATLGAWSSINGSGTFNNANTLDVTGAWASIGAYLNNTGAINVAGGADLTLSGGASSSTPVHLATGSGLTLDGGTYALDVAGTGDVWINSYSSTIMTGAIVANSLTAVAIDGTYAYTVNGPVTVGTLTVEGWGFDILTLNGQLNATTVTVNGGDLVLNSVLPNTIADLTNNSSVSGTGSLNVTNSFVQGTTSSLGGSFSDISITQAAGDLIIGGLTASNSISLSAPTGSLTITDFLTASAISASGGSGLVIDPPVLLTASGAGNAIVLNAGTGNFVNNAGAGLMNLTGGGSWLVYSNSPLLDTRGGLVYDFKQYNTAFGGTILGTGNGFIYTLSPVITVGLTGTVGRVYDGTNVALLAAGNFLAPVGAIDGDVIAAPISATGSYDSRNVGTARIVTASGSLTATNGAAAVYGYQYSSSGAVGTITPATLTLSAVSDTRVYDGTTGSLGTVSVAGLLGTDSVTGASQSYTSQNVLGANLSTLAVNGSYVVNDGNGGANYTVVTSSAVGTITPATLTYAANAASRLYGAADPAFGGSVTGFVLGDTLGTATTGTVTFTTTALSNSGVGSYAINGGGLTATNYVFAQASGNGTAYSITPATLTFTANTATRTYGAVDPAFSGSVTGFVLGDTLGTATTGTVTFTTTALGNSSVGSYAINGGGLTATNYVFAQAPGNGTAYGIIPAALTITADSLSKYEGTLDPTLTYTAAGLQAGDSPVTVFSGSLGRAPGEATGSYAIDQGSLTPLTANYTISFVPGTFTILPLPSITPPLLSELVNVASTSQSGSGTGSLVAVLESTMEGDGEQQASHQPTLVCQ